MTQQLEIKREANRIGISRLCHFTESRKLAHILSESTGILATKDLESQSPDVMDVTDNVRMDGYIDHISCSIEYPNSWYFRKIKDRDPLFVDWVVILLSPALLWAPGVKFCRRNAAAQGGSLVAPGFDGFKSLYQDNVTGAGERVRSRPAEMLPCCPTDDQAEVLVPNLIETDQILAIATRDSRQAEKEISRLSMIPNVAAVNWIIAPHLFDVSWSPSVRRGKRPSESRYERRLRDD